MVSTVIDLSLGSNPGQTRFVSRLSIALLREINSRGCLGSTMVRPSNLQSAIPCLIPGRGDSNFFLLFFLFFLLEENNLFSFHFKIESDTT